MINIYAGSVRTWKWINIHLSYVFVRSHLLSGKEGVTIQSDGLAPVGLIGERYIRRRITKLDESAVLLSREQTPSGKPRKCQGHEIRPQGVSRCKPLRG